MSQYQNVSFTNNDVVNAHDFIPQGEYNPHNIRPFLLHDHGFTVAVVFANCLQDALDVAANANKMDRYLVSEFKDYNEDEFVYLGDASEPFDIDSLQVIELPNTKFNFEALFDA